MTAASRAVLAKQPATGAVADPQKLMETPRS
jgi:hypothetical protein